VTAAGFAAGLDELAVILSGGNIERQRFLQVLGGATPVG